MTIKKNELNLIVNRELDNFLRNENWIEFLKSSSFNYKYNFINQVAIFTQKPEATTCATFDQFEKMNRYVRRNTGSIGIFDRSKSNGIERIFDITQTGQEKEKPSLRVKWEIDELDLMNHFQSGEYQETLKNEILNSIKLDNVKSENLRVFAENSILYKVAYRLGVEDLENIVPGEIRVPKVDKKDLIRIGNIINNLSEPIINDYRRNIKILSEEERNDISILGEWETSIRERWERDSNIRRDAGEQTDSILSGLHEHMESSGISDGRNSERRSEQLWGHERTGRNDGQDSNSTTGRERGVPEAVQSILGRNEDKLLSGQVDSVRYGRGNTRGEGTERTSMDIPSEPIQEGQAIDRELPYNETSQGLNSYRETKIDESVGSDRGIEDRESTQVQINSGEHRSIPSGNNNLSNNSEINEIDQFKEGYEQKLKHLVNKLKMENVGKGAEQASFFNIEKESERVFNEDALLSKLKNSIIDFINYEYNNNLEYSDFDNEYPDLSKVQIAYTTTPDGKAEITYVLNLENYSSSQFIDGEMVSIDTFNHYKNSEKALKRMIEYMENEATFDDMVYLDADDIERKLGMELDDDGNLYDPLSQDLDGDGVIDRHDADFRDSRVQAFADFDDRDKELEEKQPLIMFNHTKNNNIPLGVWLPFEVGVSELLKEHRKHTNMKNQTPIDISIQYPSGTDTHTMEIKKFGIGAYYDSITDFLNDTSFFTKARIKALDNEGGELQKEAEIDNLISIIKPTEEKILTERKEFKEEQLNSFFTNMERYSTLDFYVNRFDYENEYLQEYFKEFKYTNGESISEYNPFTEEEQATSLMIMNLYKVKNDTFKIAYNFTDDYKESNVVEFLDDFENKLAKNYDKQLEKLANSVPDPEFEEAPIRKISEAEKNILETDYGTSLMIKSKEDVSTLEKNLKPTVYFNFSEHELLAEIIDPEYNQWNSKMSFALANKILGELNEEQHYNRAIRDDLGYYKKTPIQIKANIDGNIFIFGERFDIGDGEFNLVDFVKQTIDYKSGDNLYRNKELYTYFKNEFIPELEKYTELSSAEQTIYDEVHQKIIEYYKVPDEIIIEELSEYSLDQLIEVSTEVPVNVEAPETKEKPILTKRQRFYKNIEAIELMKILEEKNVEATESEKEILKGYTGWGSIPEAFESTNNSWNKEYLMLKDLLSPTEYEKAAESVLNAFYTSHDVIDAMYEIISNFGLKQGTILEPSMGIGSFLERIPGQIKGKFYGVELDSITGRIAQKIYPEANIYVRGFEETNFKNNTFDLAIGNIPFGNYNIFDRDYLIENYMIHDYFIAKSLYKVREGGIVAFVTSKGTMDKKDSNFRKQIAKNAELVGALRLPNNAFVGTQVTSDILFFKKDSNREINENDSWIDISTDENGFTYNKYFVKNPQFVLGELKEVSGRFGPELTCISKETNIRELFKNIIDKFPKNIYEETDIEVVINPLDLNLDSIDKFSYGIVNNQIYYRNDDELELVSSSNDQALKEMIVLRDELRTLYNLQINDFDEKDINEQQTLLNTIYDSFLEKYGYINDKKNVKLFSRDDSISILKALENFDTDRNYIGKADVFTERVINGKVIPKNTESSLDGLIMSINNKGMVDLEYISNLCNSSIEKVEQELLENREIFLNPKNNRYETKDEYLSGDVKSKLKIARAENLINNVKELQKVIPENIPAEDIEFRLGSTWIPEKYIERFIREIFHHYTEVKYTPETAKWHVESKNVNDVTTTIQYGTERLNALHILERTLNLNERIKIYDAYTDAEGKEQKILNKNETVLVGEKQELIKKEFKDWLFEDQTRRDDLVKIYNEKFNFIKPRDYSGENLSFNGINATIILNNHQKNAVARSIFGGNTLMAHTVGAGKTYSAIATTMESKRLGLSNKTLIAVPNHLTEQWGADFIKLYPNSNVLVATQKDFTKEKRQEFFGKIANGNYDAVIIGHSQLIKVPMSQNFQEKYIRDEIFALRERVSDLSYTRYDENKNRYTIKQLQQMEKKLEVNLKKLMEKPVSDDNVATFEELGIDKLIVDEAHEFKNLQVTTSLTGVSGISTSASQKAFDLYLKCRYMDQKTESKGIVFLTGTPISNSMAELFVMQKYLQNDLLVEKDLSNFDAWASTFGDIQNSIQLKPEGDGYQIKTKFSKFSNLPELMTMFRENADIKTSKDLNLPVPAMVNEIVEINSSEIQKEMVQGFGRRADLVRNGLDSRIDNLLKITNDGRKLALDQRLLNSDLPDEKNSKVNACVDKVLNIYKQTEAEKLSQIIFCDLSTPKKHEFNVYDDIKKKLTERGIKENEIAFIHEAKNEEQKELMFDKVREGDIRILIGSTAKMGTGTNVQKKLIALHNLDCPWRPSDREQRIGRIQRRGNENEKIYECTYITKGTFDAYMFQILENKQRFISQIMSNDNALRVAEDIDETVLNFAEIKALCTDNPLIKEKMELENDINKMSIEKSSHLKSKIKLEKLINNVLPSSIIDYKNIIENITKDIAKVKTFADNKFSMNIGGITYGNKKEAGEALQTMYKAYNSENDLAIGKYKNFDIFLDFDKFYGKLNVILKDESSYKVELGASGEGNMQRIENKINSLETILDGNINKLNETEQQLEIAKIEYDEPYRYEEEYTKKLQRLKEININIELGDNGMVSIEEAKEVLNSKSLEINGYSNLDFSVMSKIEFISRENIDNKLDIYIDLEDPKLIIYMNDIFIDKKEYQSVTDLVEFELKNFDLNDKLKMLIAEEKISNKNSFIEQLMKKIDEKGQKVIENLQKNPSITEYSL